MLYIILYFMFLASTLTAVATFGILGSRYDKIELEYKNKIFELSKDRKKLMMMLGMDEEALKLEKQLKEAERECTKIRDRLEMKTVYSDVYRRRPALLQSKNDDQGEVDNE